MVGWIDVLPLLLAWVLDICIGDPMWIPHPVVGFGKLISKGEQALNKGIHRMLKGALLALLLVHNPQNEKVCLKKTKRCVLAGSL